MSSSSLSNSSSNRLSLNLSNCPRPLHLVNPSPESTPPSTSKSPRPNPRRQSSISYLPRSTSDRDPNVRLNLSSPRRYNSTRSNSVSVGGSLLSSRDRRSKTLELDGPPLTLAEQHSELLHFIAQKESICLELRSQLATHEAELCELKRKWERIISRGFEVSGFDGTSSQGSGAMLEGIREGVQGVSRFIAAGFAISELSPPSTSTHPQPALRRTHTASQSNSSISTNTTKSTRFSQSSTSSIGEEPLLLKGKDDSTPPREDDAVQVLIVRDTGATPTMSPNPDFVRKQQQYEHEQEQEREQVQVQERSTSLASCSTHSSFETEPDCFPSSSMNKRPKMHQRRSRDNSNNAGPTISLDNLRSPTYSTLTSRSTSPSVDLKREAMRVKRTTMNGSSFPPMSSIPGLSSLAVAATSPPAVSSWVGSVGKKWEELQRGSTFSKSQKRASLLISDVSQSIASAISISSPSPLTSSAPSTPPTTPSYFSPFVASPATASTTSASLLDNDDDIPVLPVMKPDLMLKPTPIPTMEPLRPPAGAQIKALADEDEEWNW